MKISNEILAYYSNHFIEHYNMLSNNMKDIENLIYMDPLIKKNAWNMVKEISKNKLLADMVGIYRTPAGGVKYRIDNLGIYFEVQSDKIIVKIYRSTADNNQFCTIEKYKINEMNECVKFIITQLLF